MTDDPFKQTQADRKDFLVPEGTKERLDAFIAREMGDGVSRTRVKALINAGASALPVRCITRTEGLVE